MHDNTRHYMKIRLIIGFFLLCMAIDMHADFNPTAYYIIDGEEMESTDAITDAQAPLSVTFRANPTGVGSGVSYEWRFVKSGEHAPFLTRYEQDTEYEFRESGLTSVQLWVSYDVGLEAELVSTINVSISTSLLEMPNAFSPNGDGVNDIYKAKDNHRSIVEFHAYIFNRWGVQLFDWTDINGGWDGTYKGSPVADGVYFCLVKAKGADGKTYNIRKDVNILRQYIEGGQ